MHDSARERQFGIGHTSRRASNAGAHSTKGVQPHLDLNASSALRLAIRDSAVVLCLVSQAYAACLQCTAELAYAIGGEKPLTPITLEDNFDELPFGANRLPPMQAVEQTGVQPVADVAALESKQQRKPSIALTMGRTGWILQKFNKVDFSKSLTVDGQVKDPTGDAYDDHVEKLVLEINDNWRHRKEFVDP